MLFQKSNWPCICIFLVLILLASGFHKSALIVIPLYLFAMLPWDTWKGKKWVIVVFLLLCIQFLVFKDFYKDVMLKLYSSYDEDDSYLAVKISYVNIARSGAVFLACLPIYQKSIQGNKIHRFWFTLNVFAFALYTFGYYVPIISRVGYFLNISQLFLIPVCINSVEKAKVKLYAKLAVCGAGCLFYVRFMRTVARNELAIIPYQTWVFTEMEPVEMPVYTILGEEE